MLKCAIKQLFQSQTCDKPDKTWTDTHHELRTEVRQGLQIAGYCIDFQEQQDFGNGYYVTDSGDYWVSNNITEFPPVSASHWLTLKNLLEFLTVPASWPAIAEGPHSGCGLNLSQNVLGEDSPAAFPTLLFHSMRWGYCNPYNSLVL